MDVSAHRRAILVLTAVCGIGVAIVNAAEPARSSRDRPAATHSLAAPTAYYTTGPQQGRPPDGRFAAGTKVRILRKAGSYTQVETENGMRAYVASGALEEIASKSEVEVTPDLRAAANSNNAFAFDLYRQLREKEGNLFFSPASISTALAMTSAGAKGMTEEQMAEVLHLNLPEPRRHEATGRLSQLLNAEEKGYQLRMANRLWGQKTYPFREAFLDVTRAQYGAELASLDFAQTEEARKTINAWVEKQTAGKIVDLIPAGVLDEMTRLVLTNAIYFKGKWSDEFKKERTEDAAFYLTKSREVTVPMMHQTRKFLYAETKDGQVLRLPYAGDDLSMIVLLPREVDGLAALEKSLDADAFDGWTSKLRAREVRVFLPRFKMTAEFQLADALKALGMTLAFSNEADFSGISTVEGLNISAVIHKAFVDVNEEGTEAAAATAVVIAPTAAPVDDPQEPAVFRADHPFVFVIRDNRTGAVLFAGRVTNPKE